MDLNKSDQKRKKERAAERGERSKTPNAKRPTDRSPARSRPTPSVDSPQRSRSPPRGGGIAPRTDNRSPPRTPLTARSPSPAPSSSLAPASARSRSKTASGSTPPHPNSPALAVPAGDQKARGSAVGKKASKSRLPPSSDAKGAGATGPATAAGIKLNLYGNNSFSGSPGESALPSGTGSNLAVGRGVGGGGSFCASPRRKPPVDAGAGGASNRYQPSSLAQQQSLALPTQQPQQQQQQQPQPPQQDKIEQIKKVVGLCRENILSSRSIIQAIHDKLVKCTTIQQLTQIAASLKPTRETYKDIKLITPEQMFGTQTPAIPKTPYGDQFNNLLKTLIVLCCEMINVLIGLMGFISSVTRDYLGGGSSSALRQVAQAGKLTRDFAQQLKGAQPQ